MHIKAPAATYGCLIAEVYLQYKQLREETNNIHQLLTSVRAYIDEARIVSCNLGQSMLGRSSRTSWDMVVCVYT